MSKQNHTPTQELDDDDQPFDQDAYFRKLGFPADETPQPGLSFYPPETMLEVRPASQWITRGRSNRPGSRELFGPLWKEGEVAVLLGGSGTGKSLLAVHIADEIARGRVGPQAASLHTPQSAKSSPPYKGGVSAFRGRGSSLRNQKVLYFDFELTSQQFSERYTAPSPIPGKLPIRRRFKFHRAAINWDGEIPPEFKGDLDEYLLHSIRQEILSSGASVVIIDNVSYLARNISSNASCTRIMKTLKLWAAAHGLSILVIAHMKGNRHSRSRNEGQAYRNPHSAFRNPHSVGRPLFLDDIAGPRSLTDLADSVFAIARSTYGPEYRYVKHLKSRTAAAPTHDDSNVLAYQLEGINGPHVSSQHTSEGEALIPQSAFRIPQSENPFLDFKFLGFSRESDHLRDYAREAREAERQEKEALRKLRTRSSRATLIDGILDGTYARYLKE